MQNEGEEDDLLDYTTLINDPQYAGLRSNAQPPSHTPVQTPINLDSESEGDEGDGKGLVEGQEPETDIRSAEIALIEQRQRELFRNAII
jgi:hypothetical protein